ncbi:hypothetical protein M427DRAFT_26847 [Gonapodya prolifera JEL478]|uniref:Uncharacterized protein n=1 Tax=Gonapodya prolifera (strain JEL478) TaxID=1344416 RepID=A0A139B0A2_GONPJ|nr:hypothetical protein M427DRAFT_26847 [Gonapodya prolifera JEL478]|eukprot:KXS22233.1 hypothetical protein M427DRAFT_26847 [Gonapodya prolifera JEL478]
MAFHTSFVETLSSLHYGKFHTVVLHGYAGGTGGWLTVIEQRTFRLLGHGEFLEARPLFSADPNSADIIAQRASSKRPTVSSVHPPVRPAHQASWVGHESRHRAPTRSSSPTWGDVTPAWTSAILGATRRTIPNPHLSPSETSSAVKDGTFPTVSVRLHPTDRSSAAKGTAAPTMTVHLRPSEHKDPAIVAAQSPTKGEHERVALPHDVDYGSGVSSAPPHAAQKPQVVGSQRVELDAQGDRMVAGSNLGLNGAADAGRDSSGDRA